MYFSYIPISSPVLGGSNNVSRHEINDGQQEYFPLQNRKTDVLIICWEPVRTMHYTVLIVDPDMAANGLNWVTSQ